MTLFKHLFYPVPWLDEYEYISLRYNYKIRVIPYVRRIYVSQNSVRVGLPSYAYVSDFQSSADARTRRRTIGLVLHLRSSLDSQNSRPTNQA